MPLIICEKGPPLFLSLFSRSFFRVYGKRRANCRHIKNWWAFKSPLSKGIYRNSEVVVPLIPSFISPHLPEKKMLFLLLYSPRDIKMPSHPLVPHKTRKLLLSWCERDEISASESSFSRKKDLSVLLLSLKFTFYECLLTFYATYYIYSPSVNLYILELICKNIQIYINWQIYVRLDVVVALPDWANHLSFPSSSRGPKMGSPSSSSLLDRRRRVSKQKELSYESICDVNRDLSFLLFRPLVNFME